MAKLVNCKTCNAEIAKSAKVCPSCGAKISKPIFTKWWFWVIIVFVIGSIGASLGSNDVKKETSSSGTQSSTVSGGSTSGSQSTSNSQDTFSLNETAVFKDIKVTATEIKKSDGESFFSPDDGNVFIGVNFTIENTSDKDQALSSLLLFDAYADEIKLSWSLSAQAAFSDGTLDGSLSPGRKMVGWYAVEVPKDTKTVELEVKSSWLSSKKAVFEFDVSDIPIN